MTRAHDDFASFAGEKRSENQPPALEPRRRLKQSAIEALVQGLDDTAATPRPAAPAPAAPASPARLAPEPPSQDATRAYARREPPKDDEVVDDGIDGSCSDPEFARFRAQRRPSGPHKKPTARHHPVREGTPRSGVHRAVDPKADAVDGTCSDPDFERFRAERKPASGSHKKTARHAIEPTPREGIPKVPTPDPTHVLANERAADPAFARFRAPEPEPAPPPAAPAGKGPNDSGPLFFGTTTQLRTTMRAKVMVDRSDDVAPELADSARDEPRASTRQPAPPLPERPS